MPSDRGVATRYAGAMAALAVEEDAEAPLQESLERLEGTMEAEDGLFMSVMANPGFTVEERRRFLRSLEQSRELAPMLRDLLHLLLEKRRFHLLPEIIAAYRHLVDEREGRLRAHVTMARPLTEEMLEQVRAALGRSTGRPVSITSAVDEALLAGAVVHVGDRVYDASLRSRLQQLQNLLLSPHEGGGSAA